MKWCLFRLRAYCIFVHTRYYKAMYKIYSAANEGVHSLNNRKQNQQAAITAKLLHTDMRQVQEKLGVSQITSSSPCWKQYYLYMHIAKPGVQ